MVSAGWALAIGLAGLLLATVSLTWQAVTFRLTGSRVVAHLRVGSVTGNPLSGQQVLSSAVGRDWTTRLLALIQQHEGTPVLMLVASNVGRLSVGMETAEAVVDDGTRYSQPGWNVNPVMGATLGAGHTVSWYVPLLPVQAVVDTIDTVAGAEKRPRSVRMELHLGTGKAVRTRESIRITPT